MPGVCHLLVRCETVGESRSSCEPARGTGGMNLNRGRTPQPQTRRIKHVSRSIRGTDAI